jgi:hypothetical protein
MPESRATASSETSKSRVAFLRHPLVVGAAVAVISAFFASLLIPSITQVTQDRPKELELKREIVERIAGATGTALGKGRAIVSRDSQQPRTDYRQVIADWGVEAAVIDGELTTYFGRGDTWQNWKTLRESIKRFVELTGASNPVTRDRNEKWLCRNLAEYVSSPPREWNLQNHCNAHHLSDETSFSKQSLGLSVILEDLRDAITLDIVETPAAGFRHSPWSLG